MEAVQLWAGVAFSARSGNTEALLNEAAAAGLQLAALTPQPGGFDGVFPGERKEIHIKNLPATDILVLSFFVFYTAYFLILSYLL